MREAEKQTDKPRDFMCCFFFDKRKVPSVGLSALGATTGLPRRV